MHIASLVKQRTFCLRSSRSKYNASTLNHLLAFSTLQLKSAKSPTDGSWWWGAGGESWTSSCNLYSLWADDRLGHIPACVCLRTLLLRCTAWLLLTQLHHSSPGSTFCADSYFCICSTPRVTAVAHKRSRSFCQKCKWQVTAKHTYTLRMWLCMKWHGAWLYGVHRTRRDSCSFMWHHPCQRCTYTTSVDFFFFKCAIIIKLVTHVEPHASAVSLLKRAENNTI